MNWINKFILILPGLLIISAFPTIVIAKIQAAQGFQKISQNFIPPNQQAPQTTSGGVTRGTSRHLASKEILTTLILKNKFGFMSQIVLSMKRSTRYYSNVVLTQAIAQSLIIGKLY